MFQHPLAAFTFNADLYRMQVAPPANGKKLWRVKRTLSVGASTEADLSLECLNNSLKISAAGRLALGKRPPAKRPKLKPGMPKDFVFVDLSPIKSSADEEATTVNIATTPPLSDSNPLSPLSLGNYSFNGTSLEEDFSQCEYETTFLDSSMAMNDSVVFGLGLMNLGYEYPQLQPQMDADCFFDSLQQRQLQPSYPTPESSFLSSSEKAKPILRRAKSEVIFPRSKSAGGFQFKTYKGPNAVRKHPRKNTRAALESSISFRSSVDTELTSPHVSLAEAISCDRFLENFLHMPSTETPESQNYGFFDLDNATVINRSNPVENDECLQSPIDFGFPAANDFFKDDLNAFCFPCI